MSRANPYQKHDAPNCVGDECTGKQRFNEQGGITSWRYCNCTCHTSRSR